jgi:hypothetical protein
MKSALFVQANVTVNTKLTSKVPFLFGKNVQFWYGMMGKSPPPPPSATFPGKIF